MLGEHVGLVLHRQRCLSDLTFRTFHDVRENGNGAKAEENPVFSQLCSIQGPTIYHAVHKNNKVFMK